MRRSVVVVAALVLAVGIGAFVAATRGDDPSETSAPGVSTSTWMTLPDLPTTTSPPVTSTTSIPAEPDWVVGAQPLPLRPDGLGEILPTPDVLVERSLPTSDLLPPPTTDDYVSSTSPIDDALAVRMGSTWSPDCPVGLDELRYLTVSFWGFDGGHHTGELIVHRDVADEVVEVFGRLHAARFPLEEVRIVTDADLDAPPTGDGNTTAAFVCRPVRGGTTPSAHASGLAIDINPFNNPYVRGDIVIPELATSYLDRTWVRPGMIVDGDVVTAAFADIGWIWGGTWASPDLMHFSATGR